VLDLSKWRKPYNLSKTISSSNAQSRRVRIGVVDWPSGRWRPMSLSIPDPAAYTACTASIYTQKFRRKKNGDFPSQ
jgi:hypothetical protein